MALLSRRLKCTYTLDRIRDLIDSVYPSQIKESTYEEVAEVECECGQIDVNGPCNGYVHYHNVFEIITLGSMFNILLLKNSIFNIVALKFSIFNILLPSAIGSGNVRAMFNILQAQKLNIQHSPGSKTRIFSVLAPQKLNVQYSPISKLDIQYSKFGVVA